MYFGELKAHSYEYQCGHETGSIRAYDDAIHWFEKILANEKKNTKHTTEEVISMLRYCKGLWLDFCDSYGMGIDIEADDDELYSRYADELMSFFHDEQYEIYVDYAETIIDEDLSIAEFVRKYHHHQFKLYLYSNGLITESQLYND